MQKYKIYLFHSVIMKYVTTPLRIVKNGIMNRNDNDGKMKKKAQK